VLVLYVIRVAASPHMYMHMMGQRKKALAPEKKVKAA